MSQVEIINRKQLETESKYSYCPYCYAEKKELVKNSNSLEMKDVLKKLWNIKTKELIVTKNNDVRPYFDSYQYCENCKRKIHVSDFYRFYVAKADGTRWFAPPKKEN